MKNHIILDFDETIADTRGFNSETCFQAVVKYFPEIEREKVYELQHIARGRTLKDIYGYIIHSHTSIQADDSFIEEVVNTSIDYQMNNLQNVNMFEGVEMFFQRATLAGKQISIVTNRDIDSLMPILNSKGLTKYLSNIISCIEIGALKPNPNAFEMILKADKLEGRNYNHSDYIYIGDSDVDKSFAQNSGIDFLIVDQYMNDFMLFKHYIHVFA
jgi:phosphoglycolate phosphatase-like HAD superfamily hydrolase